MQFSVTHFEMTSARKLILLAAAYPLGGTCSGKDSQQTHNQPEATRQLHAAAMSDPRLSPSGPPALPSQCCLSKGKAEGRGKRREKWQLNYSIQAKEKKSKGGGGGGDWGKGQKVQARPVEQHTQGAL